MKWPSLHEKFKGFWHSLGGTRQQQRDLAYLNYGWTERCKYYDSVYEKHPLAKSCILGIAGRVLEQGLFIKPPEKYDRAEDAAYQCEELNKRLGIDIMLYDTLVSWAKYGSCFWELTTEPVFDARIIPNQELITPKAQDGTGNILSWTQNLYGTGPVWTADDIIPFQWNVTSKSWPYGTSLLVGCTEEFAILEQLEGDIAAHMKGTAFPGELWQVGDQTFIPTTTEMGSIKSDVKNWQPGEKFVTNYPIKREASAPGDKGIANLPDVLNFCKDNITDALMISPISKMYNSTYASSKEMQDMEKARLVVPLQRIISHVLREQLYKPFLEGLGYSVRVVPNVEWQPADADMTAKLEAWATAVQSGIVPAEYAAEMMGFDMDKIEEYRVKEQKRREEQFKLQQAQVQAKFEQQQNQKGAPSSEQTITT